MLIFPAIDLYKGQAVRLFQGDYNEMTIYDKEPLNTAKNFEDSGAKWLHIVDLEGAKDGTTANLETIIKIIKSSNLNCEVGGGVRSLKIIEKYMPGPLTIVLNKKEHVLEETESETLAIRLATSKTLEDIIKLLGAPIYLTSANIAGEKPYSSLEEIENKLPSIDGILEGEPSYQEASTIVDCTKEELVILRQGPIQLEQLLNIQ